MSSSSFDRARDRYYNDAAFAQVVDMIHYAIAECNLTPSEVREAAFLACLKIEERRCHPMRVVVAGDSLKDPRVMSSEEWSGAIGEYEPGASRPRGCGHVPRPDVCGQCKLEDQGL